MTNFQFSMNNSIKYFLFFTTIISVFFVPVLVFAQIVPCTDDCGWTELILLSSNILTFLIGISIPLSAVAFAWAGFIYLTAGGNEEKIKQAHSIFWKVGVGLILVLSAWLIVWSITSALLNQDYILLKGV